jgi:hypothetical protein
VTRGRPRLSHRRQDSNKHYKQKLVRVLLDSGSDGNLVFIDKDKPILLPSSKRLVPQLWNTSNGMFQTKRKAKIERNFFEYFDSKGLKVNAAKSTFCALEIKYLGYVLTRDSIKPQSNKVQAILAIKPPTGVKQLRYFLGMVQCYRDIWARWSHMLAPLTSLVGECGQTKSTKAKGTKKVPWHWDEVHQRAFDQVKATIAKDVVLAYPDYSKVFEIYTDASSKQLGAVITQGNRPIAFFIWKLSDAQRKYSVTKIELLAIVKTLKEFKGMLWGQQIKVFIDHANLMRDALGLTLDHVY